jgi:DNA-binding response OmpR family regulator
MRQVLIIEDDPDIAKLVALHLGDVGLSCDIESDGQRGFELVRDGAYDLVVLDVMLPGKDGLEICRRLRLEQIHTPVLMLTARSEELDRVLGLELGADDYLTKPFSVRELVARVKAIFRRMELSSRPDETAPQGIPAIRYRDLLIDHAKRKVQVHGNSVDLTAREFDLLAHFARYPGRCYTRQQLLDAVWGYQYAGYEHTVNSHISRLRAKIEDDPSNPTYIETVWGVGYRLAE